MPSFTTNTIKAAYNGELTTVQYWASGNGRRVEGYTTSLAQLKTKLRSRFHLAQLTLHCVTDRRARTIVTDKHLLAALAAVRKGGTLLLNVCKYEPVQSTTAPKLHHHSQSTSKSHSISIQSPRFQQHTRNANKTTKTTKTTKTYTNTTRNTRRNTASTTASRSSSSPSSTSRTTPPQFNFTVSMLTR